MATTYTISTNINCWKNHECVECGCEFRYRFMRLVQGQGNSERAAVENANRKVAKIVEEEVEIRPCPTCGRVQPDMISQGKAGGHGRLAGYALPTVAVPFILGATYVIGGDIAAFSIAAILLIVILLQLRLAVQNPNRNRSVNIAQSELQAERGELEIILPGEPRQAVAPSTISGSHVLGLLAGLLSVGVALSPVVFKSLNQLPVNADTKPDVVSPGENVKLYFPDTIDCVKNLWSGREIQVEILNREELGFAVPIATESSQAVWSNGMSVKPSQKHTTPSIWACLAIPADSRLASKTLQARVSMKVVYPQVTVGNQFLEQTTNVSRDVTLLLSPMNSGRRYRIHWTIALIVAGALSVTSGFYLRSLAKQLPRYAIPPIVQPIENSKK
jgi:hypothetical protein